VQSESRGLFIGTLDGGEPVRVLADENPIVFVPPDILLEARRGALIARKFDPVRGTVSGEPVPIAPTVGIDSSYVRGAFTASANGVLAYRPGAAERRQLTWVDQSGKVLGPVGAPDDDGLGNPELAPDGRRVAVLRTHEGNTDVWLIETVTGVRSRFTFNDANDFLSVWSPDGRTLVFSSNRNRDYDLFEKPTNGSGADRLLLHSTPGKIPTSFSPDGRLLIYQVQVPKTGIDIWALPVRDSDPKPFPVIQTVYDEMGGQISPNGRWLAYQSNASGNMEVYVRQFPDAAIERQLSTAGGAQPRWAATGKELFYVAPDARLMAVTIAGGRIPPQPKPAFRIRCSRPGSPRA
jgi:Tol biopolymer transport system component